MIFARDMEEKDMPKIGNWQFNKEMVAMAASFLFWVVISAWRVAEWQTTMEDWVKETNRKLDDIAITVQQLPVHTTRISVLETKYDDIKQNLQDLRQGQIDGQKAIQDSLNQLKDKLISK